jgi:CBS domain containing-hemolysin-like protein
MDDPAPVIQAVSNSEIVIFAISAIILLALSAVFSASEVAFFSLSPVDKLALDEDTSRSSKSALKLLQQPKDLLATILIGNNFVNVCIAIMSTGFLEKVLPSAGSLGWLRFTVEIFGITAAILLFGEVVPKMYSTRHAKSITLLMSQPLLVLNNVPPVSWLRWLLVNGTNLVNKRAKKRGVNISSDELEQAIAMTIEDDATKDEQRILEGIVKFGNTEVRQIMCSRLDCVTISYDQSFQDVIKMILEAGYSRMPVYQETFDQIVGILYIKDLLPFLNEENFEWQNLVRKPYLFLKTRRLTTF